MIHDADCPTILVVDDDTLMRTIVHAIQAATGISRLTVCSNVSSARTYLGQTKFDLVLSDIQMEPEGGLELLRYIRSHAELRHLPVVLMTASDCIQLRCEAEQAGADQVLQKPFSPALLRTTIAQTLQNTMGQGQSSAPWRRRGGAA